MSTPKRITLEMYRNYAQTFTSASAGLTGIFWIVTSVFKTNASSVSTAQNILVGATIVGGVVMGLLYGAYKLKK